MAVMIKNSGGGENVTPEVTAQNSIIQNLTESLVGKLAGANASADKILKGYSAYVGQNLINGTLERANLQKGKYIWKKCQYTPKLEVTNPQVTVTSTSSSYTITLSNPNFDLSKVKNWTDFFKGINYNETYQLYLNSSKRLVWSYSTYSDPVVITDYNATSATNATFTKQSMSGNSSSYVYSYTGTKVIHMAHVGDVIEYLVSDNLSAYPDKAVGDDGYWYEKISDVGALAEYLGYTKIAVDYYVPSSDSSPYQTAVPHSLQEKPKLIFITTLDSTIRDRTDDGYFVFGLVDTTPNVRDGYSSRYYSRGSYGASASYQEYTINDTTFIGAFSGKYKAGAEYIVITFA